MFADLARVVSQVTVPHRFVRCLECVEVRRKRRLCIHHDVFAAWNADDEVRTQRPVVRRRRHLRDVVAMLDHPRVLDDVPQLGLPPAAAYVRCPERVREAPGSL